MDKACGNCRYFLGFTEQADDGSWQDKPEGICRRYHRRLQWLLGPAFQVG